MNVHQLQGRRLRVWSAHTALKDLHSKQFLPYLWPAWRLRGRCLRITWTELEPWIGVLAPKHSARAFWQYYSGLYSTLIWKRRDFGCICSKTLKTGRWIFGPDLVQTCLSRVQQMSEGTLLGFSSRFQWQKSQKWDLGGLELRKQTC